MCVCVFIWKKLYSSCECRVLSQVKESETTPLTFSVTSQTIPFRAKYIFGERTPLKFFSSSVVNTVSGLEAEAAEQEAEAAEAKAEAPLVHDGTEAEAEPAEAEYDFMPVAPKSEGGA